MKTLDELTFEWGDSTDLRTCEQYVYDYMKGEMNWISVKDRLPEGGDKFSSEIVIGYNSVTNSSEITFYWKIAKHWKRMDDSITHWMPLPEPPKF